MPERDYRYLSNIDSPDDLKKLNADELADYCTEMRDFIVRELSVNPGHLASSLGTVELTTAIHYVFNTPTDKVIWDVGHQAYAHKIITGRRDMFNTNRKLNGLSGFPRMEESPYDAFGGGHASVSISAAFGMAKANELNGGHQHIVAIIGDGALTGGLAFEGLNNAGASKSDLLVILNDNNMAIAPSVGAMKEYLLSMSTSKRYNNFKNRTWNALSGVPRLRRALQKMGNMIKLGLLQQSNMFESLNFRYFGPVDGHDIKSLIRVLNDLKEIRGPKLLHVLTVKGKGYEPAEKGDPAVWHAPGCFDVETGRLAAGSPSKAPKYQDVFGQALVELARADKRVVGVTPAMPTGCSMDMLMKEMPERCFDVGIAEGHAVTFSAGMAAEGLIPFCNIYSSFMQRAYDNVIHDVLLQRLHVVMCLDRAGVVGEDGSTHQGAFDMAYFRCLPDIIIGAPLNECELRDMMFTALHAGKPFVIRYPRGRGEGLPLGPFKKLDIGKSTLLRKGNDLALLTIGTTGNDAAKAADRAAAEGVDVEHVNLRWAKPLDTAMLHDIGRRFDSIITVEDGALSGGVGSEILEFMSDNGYKCNIRRLGIGDDFVKHATVAQQKAMCGYDQEAIYNAIKSEAARLKS